MANERTTQVSTPASSTPPAAPPKVNLPNHKDRGIQTFLRIASAASVVHRQGKDEHGDTDVVEEKINQVCPEPGCGYPLVDRIKDEKGRLELRPTNWLGSHLRMCGWDPAHYCKEIAP